MKSLVSTADQTVGALQGGGGGGHGVFCSPNEGVESARLLLQSSLEYLTASLKQGALLDPSSAGMAALSGALNGSGAGGAGAPAAAGGGSGNAAAASGSAGGSALTQSAILKDAALDNATLMFLVSPQDLNALDGASADANPSLNTLAWLTEVFFERFKIKSLCFFNTASCGLFATGTTRGLVLEVGDGVSHAVPVSFIIFIHNLSSIPRFSSKASPASSRTTQTTSVSQAQPQVCSRRQRQVVEGLTIPHASSSIFSICFVGLRGLRRPARHVLHGRRRQRRDRRAVQAVPDAPAEGRGGKFRKFGAGD